MNKIGQKKGFKHSEATKKKISETLKQKSNSPNRFQKGVVPATAFKPGHIPPHKGKKCPNISTSKTKERHPNWKGGKFIEQGYLWIYMPTHPFNRNKYVKNSRLVMEKSLNRYLTSIEQVHHKNGNRLDDKITNLLLCTRSEHSKLHRKKGHNCWG